MLPGLTVADCDCRAWLDRVVNVAQGNSTGLPRESGATVFAGKSGHQTAPAQRQQETTDDHGIRVDAAGE